MRITILIHYLLIQVKAYWVSSSIHQSFAEGRITKLSPPDNSIHTTRITVIMLSKMVPEVNLEADANPCLNCYFMLEPQDQQSPKVKWLLQIKAYSSILDDTTCTG